MIAAATAGGFPDRVVTVHDALEAAGIGHAFGGALALAYYWLSASV